MNGLQRKYCLAGKWKRKKKINIKSVQEENHNLDKKVITWGQEAVTKVRKPRIVSKQKTNTPFFPPFPPPLRNKNPTESNGRNTTGRVAHVHFSTLQVTTLPPLSFQHLPAKILMLVYRE